MSEIIWLDENETEPRKQNFAIRQLLERAPGVESDIAVIQSDITDIESDIAGILGGGSATVAPQGRLTLATATPVMTTTQSAKTTIYYTPYVGDQVPIYSGSAMVTTTFAELSVGTSDTTKSPAAIGASKVNDWFVWNDSGTIRVGHGPDWTNSTTRSAGTALTLVHGILLNNASITNGPAASRGTYVGTTRSNGSSQLDWIYPVTGAPPTAGFFGLFNAYNQETVAAFFGDSTSTWTYGSASWRQIRGDTTAQITYVDGSGTTAIDAKHASAVNGADYSWVGVGIDSNSAVSGISTPVLSGASFVCGALAAYSGVVGLGVHVVSAIEFGAAVPSQFLGSFSGGQTGLLFSAKI